MNAKNLLPKDEATKRLLLICATILLGVVIYVVGTQYVSNPHGGIYSRLTGHYQNAQ